MGNLGHDGVQLFLGRHVGLVLTLVLVFLTACKVCALLQGAYTHHEKFIQIGAINGKEFHLLCQRDILILAQHQHTAVKSSQLSSRLMKIVSSFIVVYSLFPDMRLSPQRFSSHKQAHPTHPPLLPSGRAQQQPLPLRQSARTAPGIQ